MVVVRTDSKNKKRPVFRIEKEISINNIETIKDEIANLVNTEKEGFHLELKEIENFDLTAAQLLWALKNKLGDKFSYSLDLRKDQIVLLEHTGINRYIQ
ncbi:MAG: STAS domain-containing protein [Bacteroidales bacterium]|nr:STAS domain-containing protein [Bacteroidales bacterium]HPO64566.1 STAS domain-containing protein [Bacteroidales bacterium]